MKSNKKRVLCPSILSMVLITTALVNCGGGDDDTDAADKKTLTMEFTGLEPLGSDYVYEGWLVGNDGPKTAGRFQIKTDGKADPSSIQIDEALASAATKYILTIEPATEDDPAPSKTHVIAGTISDNAASLSVGDSEALNTDFSAATTSGTFVLATPTSADTEDEDQGIWWLNAARTSSGLTLPTLPAGWKYEGWVVGTTGPVSTGKFTGAEGLDSDGAGEGAGTDGCSAAGSTEPCPAVPGQDFITPPIEMPGLTAVISVEPDPDDSTAPFALKPLIAKPVADDVMTSQDMTNQSADNNPTGSITIK